MSCRVWRQRNNDQLWKFFAVFSEVGLVFNNMIESVRKNRKYLGIAGAILALGAGSVFGWTFCAGDR